MWPLMQFYNIYTDFSKQNNAVIWIYHHATSSSGINMCLNNKTACKIAHQLYITKFRKIFAKSIFAEKCEILRKSLRNTKKKGFEILNFLRKFSFAGNPIRVPGCLMGSRWHDLTQDRCRWGKLWVSYLSPYCTALVLNHEFSCTLGSFHELLGLPLNPIYKIYERVCKKLATALLISIFITALLISIFIDFLIFSALIFNNGD